jgi:phage terminase large subunit
MLTLQKTPLPLISSDLQPDEALMLLEKRLGELTGQSHPARGTGGKAVVPPEQINDAYKPHLNNLARIQIFFGGSSSGKSVFLAQRCVIDLGNGGRNILVCRQVGRTLRGSVVQEIKKVISESDRSADFTINKTDGTVTHTNGYQIVFAGLDDVEKLKSITPAKGVFTDVWVEEATETERATIKQLLKRQRGGDPATPKRLTLSFNPILQSHWIYEDYFSAIGWANGQTEHISDGLSILKTTYKDNRFLTPEDVRDLENETDKYYHDVYTLGNWGVLGHVIFTNWRVEDLSAMREQFTNRRNGLDFGFSSNPAAMHRSHYDRMRKIIYWFAEMYETGLTNDVLADRVKKKIERDAIKCDSAEPKSIAELRQYGVNAVGARKGKDSVLHGIQWIQQQTIIVDASCVAARNELSTYHWKEDATGNATETPVDKDNHLIDATRYAYEDDMTVITVGGRAKIGNYTR